MITFFTIVFIVYFSANLWLFYKGFSGIPELRKYKLIYFVSFAILSLSFIAGKILESRNSSVLSDILNITGGFWLGFLLYAVLLTVLADITLLAIRLSGLIDPEKVTSLKRLSYILSAFVAVVLIIAGFINAITPVVRNYSISVAKDAGEITSLRIASVSDIHLGSVIRKRSMRLLSGALEREKPDVIFLLGDIVDGDIGPVLRGDLLGYFKAPETKYGLYGITGNHEFIGGASRTIPYIESRGIRLLKDEVITLGGGIQVIGRLDRDSRGFGSGSRKPLSELVSVTDSSRPVILLDHQPFNLDETEKAGVDLQLSGHTHHGQMWPLNLITKKIYEVSHGYLKKGDTHIIVSSGFGLWGPRIRLGSRSEIVITDIQFTGAE
ncbi:MAG: metallophosphoesterase [Bacteroidales bacterium]|nr:metallophosphoesterase [Bacteroidales bacterium]